jgi:hypothetical protein
VKYTGKDKVKKIESTPSNTTLFEQNIYLSVHLPILIIIIIIIIIAAAAAATTTTTTTIIIIIIIIIIIVTITAKSCSLYVHVCISLTLLEARTQFTETQYSSAFMTGIF